MSPQKEKTQFQIIPLKTTSGPISHKSKIKTNKKGSVLDIIMIIHSDRSVLDITINIVYTCYQVYLHTVFALLYSLCRSVSVLLSRVDVILIFYVCFMCCYFGHHKKTWGESTGESDRQ